MAISVSLLGTFDKRSFDLVSTWNYFPVHNPIGQACHYHDRNSLVELERKSRNLFLKLTAVKLTIVFLLFKGDQGDNLRALLS